MSTKTTIVPRQMGFGTDQNKSRVIRKRSSRACHCCRDRKVRCDVAIRGHPCTNCRLDDRPCYVPETDRRRRNSRDGLIARRAMPNKPRRRPTLERIVAESDGPDHHLISKQSGPPSLQTVTEPQVSPSSLGNEPEAIHGSCPLFDPLGYSGGVSALLLPPPNGANDQFLFEPHSIYHTRDASIDSTGGKPLDLNSPNGTYRNRSLPPYITPLPPRISEDDIEYLANKGALSLPPDGLRNSLLRGFIDFVYPYMPVLSLSHIITSLEQGASENGTISLLLFQAIMFAGSAFADPSSLKEAGFETRKIARRVLFHRARLLYDFGYEQEEIALIQTFLLLSYWFETPNDEKNTWHWLALATSLCQVSGFHHNPEKLRHREHLKKRIWWSCFMRDRLVALATKSPTRIKFEDCDVPMLTMEDFEILDVSWNKACVSGCSFLADVKTQRDLALMCIEKAKLCISLGHVLATVDLSKAVNQGYDTPGSVRARMMLLAPDSNSPTSVAQEEKGSLGKWAANLPDEAIYQRPRNDHINISLTIHAALLQMLYFATTLYATTKLTTGDPISSAGSPAAYSFAEKARLAALEITQIAEDLQELHLIRYLPTSGVTPIILAAVVHLRCIKAGSTSIWKPTDDAFRKCVQIMQGLRENYFSADVASSLMTKAMRNIDGGSVKSSAHKAREEETGEARGSVRNMIPASDDSQGISNRSTEIETSPFFLPSSLFQQEVHQSAPVSPRQTISPTGSDHSFDVATNLRHHEVIQFYQDEMGFENLMTTENLNGIFGGGNLF